MVKLPLWIFNPSHAPYRLQQPSHPYQHPESSYTDVYQPTQYSPTRPSVYEIFQDPQWSNSPVRYHHQQQAPEITTSFQQSEDIDPFIPQPSYAFDPFAPQQSEQERPLDEWGSYPIPTDVRSSVISPSHEYIPLPFEHTVVDRSLYGMNTSPSLPPPLEIANPTANRAQRRPLPRPEERGYSSDQIVVKSWTGGVESNRIGNRVDDQQDLESIDQERSLGFRSFDPMVSQASTPTNRDRGSPSAVVESSLESRIGASPTYMDNFVNNNAALSSSSSPGKGIQSPSRRGINGPRPLPIPPTAVISQSQRHQQATAAAGHPIPSEYAVITGKVANPTSTPAPLQSPRPRAFVEVGADYMTQPPARSRYEEGRAVSPVVEMLEGMVVVW